MLVRVALSIGVVGILFGPSCYAQKVFYHYTSEDNLKDIKSSMQLKPSLGSNGDAIYGDGVYMTDLQPSLGQKKLTSRIGDGIAANGKERVANSYVKITEKNMKAAGYEVKQASRLWAVIGNKEDYYIITKKGGKVEELDLNKVKAKFGKVPCIPGRRLGLQIKTICPPTEEEEDETDEEDAEADGKAEAAADAEAGADAAADAEAAADFEAGLDVVEGIFAVIATVVTDGAAAPAAASALSNDLSAAPGDQGTVSLPMFVVVVTLLVSCLVITLCVVVRRRGDAACSVLREPLLVV